MGRKKFGKPLKCKKQYKRKSTELSKLLSPRLGPYKLDEFFLVYCHVDDRLCGYRGKEEKCPNNPEYEGRLSKLRKTFNRLF